MIIAAENEYEGGDLSEILSFDWIRTADDVAREVLREEKCPYECEADLLLIGSERMREINSETRGIDRATDVLSFPGFQYDPPASWKEAEESRSDNFDPETGKLMLGEIVISVPKVKEQAEEYGHSTRREFAFLVSHSMLHLIGYDHMVPEEEKVMFEKQEKVLEVLGITRDVQKKEPAEDQIKGEQN